MPEEAWAVPPGWLLNHCAITGSTNDDARAAVRQGALDRTIFLADEQRQGRGRLGRSWVAPPRSGLLMSIVLTRDLPPIDLTALCSVSIVDAIAETTGIAARIKWPNDVMIGERKVCGILTEVASRGRGEFAAIVGIGVNVNLDPATSGLQLSATSLSAELGMPVSRAAVFAALIRRLDADLAADDQALAAGLRARWESLLWRRRQRVRVALDDHFVSGVVEGLTPSGGLLLRGDDGRLTDIIAGDVLAP